MARKPSGMDLDAYDRGQFRKPLFGNRHYWYPQKIRPGWWTDTLTRASDQKVKAKIVDEMSKVLDQIARD